MAYFFVLTLIPSVCFSEILVSMYQAPSDQNKAVLECSFTDGRKDVRLVVKNDDLESDVVVKWFDLNCKEIR